MFITSFMPLWISMIISDIWTIVESGIKIWRDEESIYFNILNICKENLVCIVVILIIGILMLTSIISINSFLNDKKKNNQPPRIKIKKAVRANKLSSEFLLAYILPMIAFDFAELKSVILFVVYFGMLAFLCIRNSNVYTNIWLEIKGPCRSWYNGDSPACPMVPAIKVESCFCRMMATPSMATLSLFITCPTILLVCAWLCVIYTSASKMYRYLIVYL